MYGEYDPLDKIFLKFTLLLSLFFIIHIFSSSSALAQENDFFFDSQTILSATSAARHEALFSLEPGVLSSLSSQEIEIISPEELYAALNYLPGIFVAHSSAGYANIYLHGGVGPFSPILVLIDGYPINIELLGIPVWPFMLIFPEQVERIEVIRSPASVYFGTYALTGAINIVTKPPEELHGTGIQGALGSQDYNRETAFYTKHLKDWHLHINLSKQAIDGFSDGQRSLEKQAVHLDVSRTQKDYTFRIMGGYYTGDADDIYNDYFLNQLLIVKGEDLYYSYLKASIEGSSWHLRVAGDFTGGDLIADNFPSLSGRYSQSTYRLQFNKFSYIKRQRINSGFEATYLHAEGKFLRDVNQIKSTIFAEDYINIDKKIGLLLGTRLNYHPISGFIISPRLSIIARPKKNISMRYSYTKSFGDPIILFTNIDINNMEIYPNIFLTAKSEKVKYISQNSHELSLKYELNKINFLISWFTYDIKNIPYFTTIYKYQPGATYINMISDYKREKIEGFDIDTKINITANTNLHIAYEYLTVKDKTSNQYIKRYPKHNFSAIILKKRKNYSFYIGTKIITKREENNIKMGDIFYLNTGYTWNINKNFSLSFSVYNLLNQKEKETPLGETIKRRFFIKLKYEW